MKKILLLFVSLVFLLLVGCGSSSGGSSVSNDFPIVVDNYVIEYENGGVTIKDYLDVTTNYLAIPATIDGKPVLKIGDEAFRYHIYLEKIILPNTLKTIGKNAFKSLGDGFPALKNVVFNNGLEVIEESAFEGCLLIESVNLPDSLKEIKNSAFKHTGIKGLLTLPENLVFIREKAFLGSKISGLDVKSKTLTIEQEAFAYNPIVKATLPTNTKYYRSSFMIYNGKWTGGSNSATVEGGELQVEYQEDIENRIWEYKHINNMETVITALKPDAKKNINNIFIETAGGRMVTAIGEGSFRTGSLNKLSMADTVKRIEKNAFSLNPLMIIYFSINLEFIGESAFKSIYVEELNLPDSINFIGISAFEDSQIHRLNIPANLKSINERVFFNNKLKTIDIPHTVEKIGKMSFAKNNLTIVNLGPNTKYHEDAFILNGADQQSLPIINGGIKLTDAEFNNLK